MITIKQLSPVHLEIIKLIAAGHTSKEIATAMNHTPSAVETYRFRILQHAGVRNSAQLVAWAYQRGILQVPGADIYELEANRLLKRAV